MDFKKEVDINISKVANDLMRKDTLSGNIKCPYCNPKDRAEEIEERLKRMAGF